METVTHKKIQGVFTALRDTFSWTNPLQAPKLEKIVISTGIGRMRKDAPKIKLMEIAQETAKSIIDTDPALSQYPDLRAYIQQESSHRE